MLAHDQRSLFRTRYQDRPRCPPQVESLLYSRRMVCARSILLVLGVCIAGQFAVDAKGQDSKPVIEIEQVVLFPIRSIQVPARVAGVIEQIRIAEGEVVKKGDMLITLDDRDERLQVELARSSRESAINAAENELVILSRRKELQLAESDLRRALDSQAKFRNSVADSEIERKKLTVEQAELGVMQAQLDQKQAHVDLRLRETEVKVAEYRQQLKTISAPISGVVARIDVELGEWVNAGDSVLGIVAVDSLKIEGFLETRQALRVQSGMRSTFVVRIGESREIEVPARISYVDPGVGPVDGRVRFSAVVKNSDLSMRPGMIGSLIIQP